MNYNTEVIVRRQQHERKRKFILTISGVSLTEIDRIKAQKDAFTEEFEEKGVRA